MFTRTKKFKNKDGSIREYLFIVENQWVKGKIKQRTVANLGRIDKVLKSGRMDALAESIAKYTQKKEVLDICKDINPLFSQNYGEIGIFRKLWKNLGLEKIFSKYFSETEKEVDLVEALFALVCNRLVAPSSKREAYEWKKEVYQPEWDQYQLHHFYRALDFLQENKEKMERELFDNTKDLFHTKVNVMMFDTTTISYWGKGKGNELLAHGYSKNKRFDLKQLVVGLIMDDQGVPLGHEVWPGNTSDKPAFKEVIDKIKTKFEIGKVILVCDRGMVSEEIINYLEENKYEYILGIKMRQLSELRKHILLEERDFTSITKNISVKELREGDLYEKEQAIINGEKIKRGKSSTTIGQKKINEYKEKLKAKRRWIIYFNKKIAREDREKREYFQKILKNKVEYSTAKEWIMKNGYKRYVNIKDMTIELNQKKLDEDRLYDGKWILISNTSLAARNIIFSYKDLAQIERHFRSLKSELEVGPVYHYVERRIRAHVFICFLALQIKVALTKKLKAIDENLSYSEVMRDVEKVKAVTFKVKDKKVIMRTDLEKKAHFAFKAAGCAVPPKVISMPLENIVPTSV